MTINTHNNMEGEKEIPQSPFHYIEENKNAVMNKTAVNNVPQCAGKTCVVQENLMAEAQDHAPSAPVIAGHGIGTVEPGQVVKVAAVASNPAGPPDTSTGDVVAPNPAIKPRADVKTSGQRPVRNPGAARRPRVPRVAIGAPIIRTITDDLSVGGDGDCWRQAFAGRHKLVLDSMLDSWSEHMVDFHSMAQVFKFLVHRLGKQEMLDLKFAFVVSSTGILHLVNVYSDEELNGMLAKFPLREKPLKRLISGHDMVKGDTNLEIDMAFDRTKLRLVPGECCKPGVMKVSPGGVKILVKRNGPQIKHTLPFSAMVWDHGAIADKQWMLMAMLDQEPELLQLRADSEVGAISMLEQISKDYNIPMSMLQTSQLGTKLLETVNKIANVSVQQHDNKPIEVTADMPDEAFQDISREFGKFKIVRSNIGSHPHPYHHASRRGVTKMIVGQYPRSDLLYDIGGDMNYHIAKDNFHVHSVFKTGNPTDAARYISLVKKTVKNVTQRQSNMVNNQLSKNVAVESVLGTVMSPNNLLWCNNSINDCKHAPLKKLAFAMSVDTLFHIKPEELIAFYIRNNVVMATHAMTIPLGYATTTSGALKFGEGTWTKSNGTLDLVFAGDSTVYSQSIEIIDSYLYEPILLADTHFMYTRVQGYKGAHIILEHYVLDRAIIDSTLSKHAIWSNYEYDQLLVNVPRILIDRPTGLLDQQPIEMVPVTLNVKFYERLLNRMMQPYSWEAIKSYAASCVGRSYVSSSGSEQIWKLNNREVMYHCIVAYWSMNRMVESIQPLITRAEERVRPTGFFQQIWKVVKTVLKDIGNELDPTSMQEVQDFVENNATDDLQLVPMFMNMHRQVESINIASQLSRSHSVINTIAKYVPITRVQPWCTIDEWREQHTTNALETVTTLVVESGSTPSLNRGCGKNTTCPHNHKVAHRHLAYSADVMRIGDCTCCGISSNIFNDNNCLLCAGHEICVGHKATCTHTHRLMHEECCGKSVCSCKHNYRCACCNLPSLNVYCRLCKPNPSRLATASEIDTNDHSKRFDKQNDVSVGDAPTASGYIINETPDAHEGQDVSAFLGENDNIDQEAHATIINGPLGYTPSTIAHTMRAYVVCHKPAGTPVKVENYEQAITSNEKRLPPPAKIRSLLENVRKNTGADGDSYNPGEAMLVGARKPRYAAQLGDGFEPVEIGNYAYGRENHVDIVVTSVGTSIDDGTCGISSLQQVSGYPISTIAEWMTNSVGTNEWISNEDIAGFAAAINLNLIVCTNNDAKLYINNNSSIAYAITTMEPIDGSQHWVPCTAKITLLYNTLVSRNHAQYLSMLRYLDTNGASFDDWSQVSGNMQSQHLSAHAYSLRLTDWRPLLQTFRGAQINQDGITHRSEKFAKESIQDYITTTPSGTLVITAPTGFGKTTKLHTLHGKNSKVFIITPSRANVTSLVDIMLRSKITAIGRADQQWYPNDHALKNTSSIRVVIMTVDAAYASLCLSKPISLYVTLLAGRKIFLDEAHITSYKYLAVAKQLGDLVTGVVTATPPGGVFSTDTRHPLVTNWVSDSAADMLFEDAQDNGVGAGAMFIVKSKALTREIAMVTNGTVAINSDTLGNANLDDVKRAVATNCVTTGVTLPNITKVIDTGKRIRLDMVGVPNLSSNKKKFYNVTTTRYSYTEAMQSRGRVGRVDYGIFTGPVPEPYAMVSPQAQLLASLATGVACNAECHTLWEAVNSNVFNHVKDMVDMHTKVEPQFQTEVEAEMAIKWLEDATDIRNFRKAGAKPTFASDIVDEKIWFSHMMSFTEQPAPIRAFGSLRGLKAPHQTVRNPTYDATHYIKFLDTANHKDTAKVFKNRDSNGYIASLQETVPVSWTDDASSINIAPVVRETIMNDFIAGLNTMTSAYKQVVTRRFLSGSYNGAQVTQFKKAKYRENQLFSFKVNGEQPIVVFSSDLAIASLLTYDSIGNIVDGTIVMTVNRSLSHMVRTIQSLPTVITTGTLTRIMANSVVIAGPPGTGKTFTMVNEHKPQVIVSKQALMLGKHDWVTLAQVSDSYQSIGIDEFGLFDVLDLLILANYTGRFVFTGDMNQKTVDETSLTTARNLGNDQLRRLLSKTRQNIRTKTYRFGPMTLQLLTKIGYTYQTARPDKHEIIAHRNIRSKDAERFRKAIHDCGPELIICPTNDTALWVRAQPIQGIEITTTSRAQGSEAGRVMYVMMGAQRSVYNMTELYVAFSRHCDELYIITDNEGAAVLQELNIKLPDYSHWDEYANIRAGKINVKYARLGLIGAVVGISLPLLFNSRGVNEWLDGVLDNEIDDNDTPQTSGINYTVGLSNIYTRRGGVKLPFGNATDNMLDSMAAVSSLLEGVDIEQESMQSILDTLLLRGAIIEQGTVFSVTTLHDSSPWVHEIYHVMNNKVVHIETANMELPMRSNITEYRPRGMVNAPTTSKLDTTSHDPLQRMADILNAIKQQSAMLYAYICNIFTNTSRQPSVEELITAIAQGDEYMPRLWMDASALAMSVDGAVGVYGKWIHVSANLRKHGLSGLEVYEHIRLKSKINGQYIPDMPVDLHKLHLDGTCRPYGTTATVFRNASGTPVETTTLTLRETYVVLQGNHYIPGPYRAGASELQLKVVARLFAIIENPATARDMLRLMLQDILVITHGRIAETTVVKSNDRAGTRAAKLGKAYVLNLLRGTDTYGEEFNISSYSPLADSDAASDNSNERGGKVSLAHIIITLRNQLDTIVEWVVNHLSVSCEWAADIEDRRTAASDATTQFYDVENPPTTPTVRPVSMVNSFTCCNSRLTPAPSESDQKHENSRLIEYVEMVIKCENCNLAHKMTCLRQNFDVGGTTINTNLNFDSISERSSFFSKVVKDHEKKMVTIKVVGLPAITIHNLADYYIVIVDKVVCMLEPIPGGYKLYWSDNNLMTNERMISTAMRVLNNAAGGKNDFISLVRKILKELSRFILIKKDVLVWTTKTAVGVCKSASITYTRSAQSVYFAMISNGYFQRALRMNKSNRCWLQGNVVLYSRRSNATVLDCHTTFIAHESSNRTTVTMYAGTEARLEQFRRNVERALGRPNDNTRAGQSVEILRRVGINVDKIDEYDTGDWLDIIMQAVQNNPLSSIAEISSERGYSSISELLDERRKFEHNMSTIKNSPTDVVKKTMAICIPSGHGKTTTLLKFKRELPGLNIVDIDDILTTINVVKMANFTSALEQYTLAFKEYDNTSTRPYIMLCHSPEVVPNSIPKVGILNRGAYVPEERIWSGENVEHLIAKANAGQMPLHHVKDHKSLFDLVLKLVINGDIPHITMHDGSELIDNIDDIGGYEFAANAPGPDSLMKLPDDGKISMPQLAEGLGTQRYYKTGPHVGLSRPTIQKIATSTFNAVSTRLHGIVKLRSEQLTDDEYLSNLSSLFVPNWQTKLDEYRTEVIGVSYKDTLDWLTNKGHKIELLHGMVENMGVMDAAVDPRRAKAHFKVENLLKEEINTILDQTGRVIVWNNQNVNMFLCPMINECKKRLTALLNPDLVSYADGMTMVEINNKLSYIPKSKYIVELDLAKQDRQTDRPIIEFEWKLLGMLGLDSKVVEYLQQAGDGFKYRTPEGITATRPIFHWSGGPMTSLGNEIRNLLLIADLIKSKEINHIFTLGDDSLILSNTEFDQVQTSLIAAQRHNVGCTFSQNEKSGLFLQLIVVWTGSKYIACHNFMRLREKMAYSSYPSNSETWKAKYISFLMMIGNTPAVATELSKLGIQSMPALGTSFEQRLLANATHNKTSVEHIASIVNDILHLSRVDSDEVLVELTMVLPRNKLRYGEVKLAEYRDINLGIIEKLNKALESIE